jgi:diguanylate cyclase (GGDEF)-like protein
MTSSKHDQCLVDVCKTLSVLKNTPQHEKVFHVIVDSIVREFKCQTCAIVVVDPKTEYLSIASAHGLSFTFEKAFRRTLATGEVGKLLWTGEPILIADSRLQLERAEGLKLENPFGSCVTVQIAVDHRTVGYLHADSTLPGAFQDEDLRTLQCFADLAGVALQKSRLAEENLRLDMVDHETGLEKYAPFLERVEAGIERAEDYGEHFGLLLLDVDNFKQIAHTYGYETSRGLLKELAGVIRKHLRPVDAAGRFGFDEFIVLRSNASRDPALAFADELRRGVEETALTVHKIRTTVSVGVTLFPDRARDLEGLLLSLKYALFEAQRLGRNQVFVDGKEAHSLPSLSTLG